jgi:hypothetical protein
MSPPMCVAARVQAGSSPCSRCLARAAEARSGDLRGRERSSPMEHLSVTLDDSLGGCVKTAVGYHMKKELVIALAWVEVKLEHST